jgi:protein-tyrosine-phosphatase
MLVGGPVLVEENFLGRGVGVEVLASEGEILTAFQHERVHEPLLGGGSSYRRAVPLHPELLEATRRLMRALEYTGVAMVEFKLDPAAGRFVVIEINGRFWGSLPLALSAGADFPWFLYQMLVLGKREFPQSFKTHLYCRNWIADFDWLRSNLRADRTDRTLATLPLAKVLGEALNLLTFKERSDTLVLDDPKPAWVELRQWFRAKWVRLRCALSLRLRSIPPFRAWARRSARCALTTSKTVLFVCQGNICRSPFAEALARTMLNNGTTLRSFGFDPREGRSSPPEAQRAAAELGVDLSRHQSRLLTEKALQEADAVFLFDGANYRRFATAFPAFRRKAHFLGQLDDAKAVTIADPWGSDPERFLQTYRRIQEALAKAVSPASSDARSSRARAHAASGA